MLQMKTTTLIQALAPWHEFYTLLGEASATMTGLLFVAASVGSGTFSNNRRGAVRMFLSASVIHFSSILAASLIVLAPISGWLVPGCMITGYGLFGVIYYILAWRDTVRDGLNTSIQWDDRLWFTVFPVIGYLLETGSGTALIMRLDISPLALAATMGVLLTVGVHNAWDITVWSITRRRD